MFYAYVLSFNILFCFDTQNLFTRLQLFFKRIGISNGIGLSPSEKGTRQQSESLGVFLTDLQSGRSPPGYLVLIGAAEEAVLRDGGWRQGGGAWPRDAEVYGIPPRAVLFPPRGLCTGCLGCNTSQPPFLSTANPKPSAKTQARRHRLWATSIRSSPRVRRYHYFSLYRHHQWKYTVSHVHHL